MSTSDAPASGSGPERPSIHALIEQLAAPYSWKDSGQWLATVNALIFGAVGLHGWPSLVHFSGIMVVVFLLHELNERRTRRQIDVLVQIVRELERRPA